MQQREWKRLALQRNPQLNDLRERIFPTQRAARFVQLHRPYTEKDDEMRKCFFLLALQAMQYYGFRESVTNLSRESGLNMEIPEKDCCKLRYYLAEAIKKTEKVYDLLLIPNQHDLLEEHLVGLGFLEDGEVTENNDVNIWEEPAGNVIRDGENIKAGTLNKLVEKLTSEESLDLFYVKTFLMTYQSFTSPHKLLEKLFQRYEVPSMYTNNEKVRACIQLRVVSSLKKWLEHSYSDFDHELLDKLNEWLQQKAITKPNGMSHTKSVLKSLRKAQQPAPTKTERAGAPEPIIIGNIFSMRLGINDIDDLELARQITLIEFDIFRQIKTSELMNLAWNKPKLKHRAPNVLKLISRFNKVSLWVANQILKRTTLKQRVKMMIKFLNIAHNLRTFNNFNTLMSIMAGFNLVAIHRLKHTRDALPERYQHMFSDLQKTVSTSSFKAMRDEVAKCDPPCFPYLGIYLTDLTFIDENPNYIDGFINFNKSKMIYNVISKIQQYQQLPYNFQPVHQIQKLLLNLSHLDEQELYCLSLVLEPRDADRSQIA